MRQKTPARERSKLLAHTHTHVTTRASVLPDPAHETFYKRHQQPSDRQRGAGPRRITLHDLTEAPVAQAPALSALTGVYTSSMDSGWGVSYASQIKVTSSENTIGELKTRISKWDRPL